MTTQEKQDLTFRNSGWFNLTDRLHHDIQEIHQDIVQYLQEEQDPVYREAMSILLKKMEDQLYFLKNNQDPHNIKKHLTFKRMTRNGLEDV